MIINLTMKNLTPLALLRKRVEQNYADFKAEMLLLDEGTIFEAAHRIAAVKDTHHQMTRNDALYLDEDEIEYLLRFHNPLGMLADYLQERIAGYPVEIDEALMELFNDDGHDETYLTMDYAERLLRKHGNGISVKVALLLETIEAGEHYMRLLKLSDKSDIDGCCGCEGHTEPFRPTGFDEDGFFVYGDDKEGCF